jgi:hypothetical protein
MNTNRDASAHTRKISARTITMHHLANPVRKGQNTEYTASYMTNVNLGPADSALRTIYQNTLGRVSAPEEVVVAPPSAPSAPAPPVVGPSGATIVQLLVNSGFTNGTTGWSSSRGFQTTTFDYQSGSQPIVVASVSDSGITGSDGYLIFSYISALVSQTVAITDISNYNILTAVINISRIPNNNISRPTPDAFFFQVVYRNASNVTVAAMRTPASGTQAASETFTDYTLIFTRDDNVNFDTITSATVNIAGTDNGFWLGQHGPVVDYCTLTLS